MLLGGILTPSDQVTITVVDSMNNNSVIATTTVDKGSDITSWLNSLDRPTHDGYTFSGYEITAGSTTNVTEDATVYLRYTVSGGDAVETINVINNGVDLETHTQRYVVSGNSIDGNTKLSGQVELKFTLSLIPSEAVHVSEQLQVKIDDNIQEISEVANTIYNTIVTVYYNVSENSMFSIIELQLTGDTQYHFGTDGDFCVVADTFTINGHTPSMIG